MKKVRCMRISALVILLSLASLGAMCGDEKTERKLVRAEDDFSAALLETANIVEDAKKTNVLSQEDIDFIKPILKTVAESHKQVIALTKRALEDGVFSDAEKRQVISMISFISDQLVELNNNGTLRIKNPEKQMLFSTAVIVAQSSATSVIVIINSIKKKG